MYIPIEEFCLPNTFGLTLTLTAVIPVSYNGNNVYYIYDLLTDKTYITYELSNKTELEAVPEIKDWNGLQALLEILSSFNCEVYASDGAYICSRTELNNFIEHYLIAMNNEKAAQILKTGYFISIDDYIICLDTTITDPKNTNVLVLSSEGDELFETKVIKDLTKYIS